MADTTDAFLPPEPLERTYHGCSGIREYEMMEKLGEGTFGEVYKGRRLTTGAVVALKKIIMHHEKEGFPITALREIKLLKQLSHKNVIKLEEMAVERSKELRKRAIHYMVTPYMEHDLSGLLDNPDVEMSEPRIKCYMLQLLQGLKYLHNSHILHRDMKAANLLINNKGILKIADFGLARHYDEPVPQAGKGGGEAHRDYTTLVVTRWYRPPELLLQLRRYTTAIDMWGAGCVLGEMFKRKPILTGQSDLHQAQIIFELIGSPNEENMPGWSTLPGADSVKNFEHSRGTLEHIFQRQSPQAVSLLRSLLLLDWRKRINAIDALDHPYFKTPPYPARPEDIPPCADSHELDRRHSKGGNRQALPPAPAGGTVGIANGEWAATAEHPPPPNGYPLDRHWGSGGHHDNRGPGPDRRDRGRDRGDRDRDRDRDVDRGRWQRPLSHDDHGPGHRGGPPGAGQSHREYTSSRIPTTDSRPGGAPLPRRQAWRAHPPLPQDRDEHEHGVGMGGAGGRPVGSHLPPPPPEGGGRHPLPPHPHGHGAKDTYIPSYAGGGGGAEGGTGRRDDRRGGMPPRERERDRDRGREKEDRWEGHGGGGGGHRRGWDRDRGRERDDYRDMDRPGPGQRRDHRERDRDRERGRDRTTTRSRSPVGREREWERDPYHR